MEIIGKKTSYIMDIGLLGRVYKYLGKNFFHFLELNLRLEGKKCKPLNFPLLASAVNMALWFSQK